MERKTIMPRDGYQKIVERLGLSFHEDYWLENAYYQFSMAEIEKIEQASNECYQMYCDAAERCLYNERLLDDLLIPQGIRPFLRRSWEDDDLSLYGRFDFAFVDGVPKLLEFNADTPTTLLEAAVVQWQWLEDVFPNADQFNSIHENLVLSWKDIHKVYNCDRYCFAGIDNNFEDSATLDYLLSTAIEAGINVLQCDMRDVFWDKVSLFDPSGNPIDCMFKLYPWEFMFNESLEACQTEMCWIEPLWKALMSNKAMLPILYEMFPSSPYILPAFREENKLSSYCKKPIFSREGENVELVKNGHVIEKNDGEYGKEGFIYQQLVDVPSFDGKYPILGSWIIGGVSCGMGIRESSFRITDDQSHFVPHIIL